MQVLDNFNLPFLFVLVFFITTSRIIVGKALLKKLGAGKVEFLNSGYFTRLIMDMIVTLISFFIVTYILEY